MPPDIPSIPTDIAALTLAQMNEKNIQNHSRTCAAVNAILGTSFVALLGYLFVNGGGPWAHDMRTLQDQVSELRGQVSLLNSQVADRKQVELDLALRLGSAAEKITHLEDFLGQSPSTSTNRRRQ